jgi:hypothetical protein
MGGDIGDLRNFPTLGGFDATSVCKSLLHAGRDVAPGAGRNARVLVWSVIPVLQHSIVLFPTSQQGYSGGEMRKTNPISADGGRSRAGTPNPFDYRSGQALQRAESCETNPISPRRRRRTEEIVRNEAKLGMTGVYGQRRLSCGAWLDRGVKRAKRTQFGAGAHYCGLRIADCGFKDAGCGRTPEAKRAKRTQFGSAGDVRQRVNVRNEPNLDHRQKMSGGDDRPTKSRRMQNEPNLAGAPGNGRGLAGGDVPPESDCAKQSRFARGGPWLDWH